MIIILLKNNYNTKDTKNTHIQQVTNRLHSIIVQSVAERLLLNANKMKPSTIKNVSFSKNDRNAFLIIGLEK